MLKTFSLSGFADFLILVPLLYAEIHYKFRGVYSRLARKEPEILADTPHRIDPGQPMPILLLIKDAHLYPILLETVRVTLSCGAQSLTRDFVLNSKLHEPWWSQVVHLEVPNDMQGHLRVNVVFKYQSRLGPRMALNDNYAATSHAPLKVFRASEKLPCPEGWVLGEFHCHTNYTSDQVEYGVPIPDAVELAIAMGLQFFCATDHSYDLDDCPGDYLKNDPELTKWNAFQREVKETNARFNNFVVVPGEEVSCGNARNRNVHLLVLNHPEFLPGAGDSAEKWFRNRPSLGIPEVLSRLSSDSIAFAAHPGSAAPFLEWLLVHRGHWTLKDCSDKKLSGLQIWNGSETGFIEGRTLWVQALLAGKRLAVAGGNDAHGNFNRFRQIGWPFLTMRENDDHLFGKVRTAVHSPGRPTLRQICSAMGRGRTVATDGPFLKLELKNTQGTTFLPGDTARGHLHLDIEATSSSEFGQLHQVVIYGGEIGEKTERILFREALAANRAHRKIPIDPTSACYVRGELTTVRQAKCLTSPIWFQPS